MAFINEPFGATANNFDDGGIITYTPGEAFSVNFDVPGIQAKDITIEVDNRRLTVNACQKTTRGNKITTTKFIKTVDNIPKHLSVDNLTCTVAHGILTVVGPHENEKHSFSKQPVSPNHASPTKLQLPGGGGGQEMFRMVVDIGPGHKPCDLKVKTVNTKFVLSAKREENINGIKTTSTTHREMDLPDNVDPNTVTVAMTHEGKITVEAPVISSGLAIKVQHE